MVLRKNYRIERVPRLRGLRIYVYPNGSLMVRCSLRASVTEIHNFIQKNKVWIENSLARAKRVAGENPPVSFREGQRLLLMGEAFTIVENSVNTVDIFAQKILALPSAWSFAKRKKEIQKFYKKKAISVLSKRMEYWAKETGLVPSALKFRNNKTLWGTCMANNVIVLNWKLICAPLSVIDYVIIHELAHIKVRNHSKTFWGLVEQFCANHRQSRLWLRKNHYAFDFLNDISEIHSSKLDANARHNEVESFI